MEQNQNQQPKVLSKPLNTPEGLREALLWNMGVIPGQIKNDQTRDFMLSQVEPPKQKRINHAS